jgi:hypothetical protein
VEEGHGERIHTGGLTDVEKCNPNQTKLILIGGYMYNGHRSRSSSPPPAPEWPLEAEKSRRDRRRISNRLSVALVNCSKGERSRVSRSLGTGMRKWHILD